MNEDERLAALIASFPVMSAEESEQLRVEREQAAERARIRRGGDDIDWDRDVNVRKWSDPVGLRVVEPAPDDDDGTARP